MPDNSCLQKYSKLYFDKLKSDLDTPPSSIESLNTSVPDPPYSMDTVLPRSDPQILVVDGETRIQDFAPPPDLTSDIVLQNEINLYQKQKAKQKGVTLKVEDEGEILMFSHFDKKSISCRKLNLLKFVSLFL